CAAVGTHLHAGHHPWGTRGHEPGDRVCHREPGSEGATNVRQRSMRRGRRSSDAAWGTQDAASPTKSTAIKLTERPLSDPEGLMALRATPQKRTSDSLLANVQC